MPSRRDILTAVAGGSLLAAAPGARAMESTTTAEPGDEDRREAWPTYRGGAGNTGALADERGPRSEPGVAWQRDLGSASARGGSWYPSAPALVSGGVVVAGGDTVALLGADHGEPVWEVTPMAPTYAQPVVARETVFLGNERGVEALDLSTGERRWSVPLDADATTVAVAGDTVYADARDGLLYALGATDGGERWRLKHGDELTVPPTVVDDTVYLGGTEVLAVDAGTGAVRWRASVPEDATDLGALAVANGRVVGTGTVDAERASLAAYDADDGGLLWAETVSKPANTRVGDAVAVGNAVFTALGGLQTHDAPSGEQQLSVAMETTHGSTPAIGQGVAYLRADGVTVRAVDLGNGGLLWSLPLSVELSTPPVVGEQTAYVRNESGTLYAIRSGAGTPTPDQVERTFGYDWVESWAPMAAVLGSAHVVGPLLLAGVVGLAERFGADDGED
jgi:outer membrane protein assembly factor BamB